MKSLFFVSILTLTLVSCKTSSHTQCDAYSMNITPEDSSIVRSMDVLSDSAENWTTEQKQEFANVFFIERGKFTVPEKPIVLKSFKGN
jgi:hypothetical protein